MSSPTPAPTRRTVLATAALAALLACASACESPNSRRVDPDVDDELGGTGIESGDIRAISDWMARSLVDRLPTGGKS